MILKKTFFTALIGLTFLSASAQEKHLKTTDECRALSQQITELFKENKITTAIGKLKLYWPIPENEISGLEEKTLRYLNVLEERFGKPEGTIKIKEETIKDIGLQEIYFVKYEKTAIRLIFTYYRSEKGWIVNAFKWDDNFIEEFK